MVFLSYISTTCPKDWQQTSDEPNSTPLSDEAKSKSKCKYSNTLRKPSQTLRIESSSSPFLSPAASCLTVTILQIPVSPARHLLVIYPSFCCVYPGDISTTSHENFSQQLPVRQQERRLPALRNYSLVSSTPLYESITCRSPLNTPPAVDSLLAASHNDKLCNKTPSTLLCGSKPNPLGCME